MRSKLLMIILISLLSLPLAAQYNNCPEELVPKYDPKKKMWGFANLLGFWEIEPYYTNVSAFTDNKAIVQRGLLFGAIDCNGNTIIQPKYQAVSPFRNGKAWVMENNKWGMVDDKGKMWISPQFSEITPIPLSDFSWVNKNGSWGLYNEETKRFSCEPQYQMAKVVSPNCSMVQVKTGLFGFINHVNCNFLVEPNITSVKKVNTSTVLFEMNGKWGVFNYDGRIKANAEFDEISLGSPNLLIVSKAGKSGLMDLSGKILLPFDYDYIGEYQNGLFPVKQGGKFGYANLLGKIYVEPKYEYAGAFKNKQAVVKENGKFGVIDMSRSYIMQPLYQEIIQHGYHDFYLVKEAGQEGVSIFTLKGSKLIEQTFDKVFTEDSSELVRVVRDKRVLFLNVRAGKIPINESFEEANAFTNNYAMVKNLGNGALLMQQAKPLSRSILIKLSIAGLQIGWFSRLLETVLRVYTARMARK